MQVGKLLSVFILSLFLSTAAQAKDLKVAFGPAIHACCYEVGAEFAGYFPEEAIQRRNKYFLDVPLANMNQLMGKGVIEENIFDCGECTVCGKDYFSFRRDGEKAGRMISIMMLQ